MEKMNKMTAEEIIKKHLSKIEGIRIPYVNKITSSILGEIKDNGLIIIDESDVQTYASLMAMKKNNRGK